MRDAAALAPLFEDASVLAAGHRPQQLRGPGDIARAAPLLWQHQRGYLADPRRVLQARDTALLLGDGIIHVARRGPDGSWRYAISVLHEALPWASARCRFPGRRARRAHLTPGSPALAAAPTQPGASVSPTPTAIA